MRIGGLSVDPVVDGFSLEPLDEVVRHTGDAAWDCPEQPLDAQGRLRMAIGGFLVRGPGRTILVDAGMGTISDERRQGGGLPSALESLGVGFPDVTDVVFTHLHFDHVGWATQRGNVTFPNATYRVHQADWDHFVRSPEALPGAVRKLTPIEDRLETFDSETELAPGLVARPAPGHSPGHSLFVVTDGDERALLLGDVVHVIPELTDPQWHGRYDLDPSTAIEVRDRIVDELAGSGDAFATSHFPDLRFGRLVRNGAAPQFTFI